MRTIVAGGLFGCALLIAGTAMLAAPGQDRPGQLTQGRVLIENRGSAQAIPVIIDNDSLGRPLRVDVTGSPAVTISGSVALPTRAIRQAWEYQSIKIPFGQDPTGTLAPLGVQGWELTGQLSNPDGSAVLLMKRPQ